MKRRSFFQSLAKAAAIVALAPQLAFRVKPDLPSVAIGWDVGVNGGSAYVLMVDGVVKESGQIPLPPALMQKLPFRKYDLTARA